MGLFQALGAIIATIIVAASTMGTIKYHYQRETTDIEEKYTNREAAEIDRLYHISYLQIPADDLGPADDFALTIKEDGSGYSDNIKTTSTGMGPNTDIYAGSNGDWDDDGLINNAIGQEVVTGENGTIAITEGDNPDTDGDGIIDSQDPAPLDPTIGGAIIPPTLSSGGGGIGEDGDRLVVTIFSKAACNPALTGGTCDKDEYWQFDRINANISDVLKFKISIELENKSSTDAIINLFDLLPSRLNYSYYPGSAEIQVNKNPIHQFTQYEDDWLENSYIPYKLRVASGQLKTYNIWFNAAVLQLPAINSADIQLPGGKLLASDSITIE